MSSDIRPIVGDITDQIAHAHNLGDTVLAARIFDRSLPNISSSRQLVVFFRNGYGASVIQGPFSYGGREGLYELALLDSCQFLDGGYEVNTDGDARIPKLAEDGVAGWLDPEGVSSLLQQIAAL